MALPANCLGNEISTRCIVDETTGTPLSEILEGLKVSPAKPTTLSLTSDDITSTAIGRSTSYICAAKIVKRDFTYTVSTVQNNTLVSWDLLPIVQGLPANYVLATTRVKITGGGKQLANSDKPSAGFTINASDFPATMDFTLRVSSPCGDIDLTSTFNIINPVLSGSYRTALTAMDLNPRNGTVLLTEQLSGIESMLSNMSFTINNQQDLISELRGEIELLKQE